MDVMEVVRQALKQHVHTLVGANRDGARGAPPRTDDGLFGPRSACWRVHGEFTPMMIGGVSALLLQMLHPGALAGVWDHSNFRGDMSGRLRRTAQFIGGTTYGSTAQATALIERVRTIHDRVHGTLPDGMPYSANDPDLLTWVHVAEVSSFLKAYRRYRDPLMPRSEQDRYYRETAIVADRLGARDIPRSRAEIAAYLTEVRPQLRFDARTREVAEALLGQPASKPHLAPMQKVIMDAGVDLLPAWAAGMHGLHVSAGRRGMARAGALGVGTVLRWALAKPA